MIHSACRSCGGPLLLGSGSTIGWWRGADLWHGQEPCRPVLTRRELLERRFAQLAAVVFKDLPEPEEAVDGWEAALREVEEQIRGLDAAPPRLGEAAVAYARWGWPVFPLLPGGKKPAIPKDQGGQGFKDATTDVVRIRRYWDCNPKANIGIATGHLFDVIDVDVPKCKDGKWTPDGREVFAKLLAQVDPKDGRGPLPDCFGINVTPTGGTHLLVLPTGEGNRGGLFPGIDTRGLGGYIVAPPSVRAQGRYRWEIPPAPQVRRS